MSPPFGTFSFHPWRLKLRSVCDKVCMCSCSLAKRGCGHENGLKQKRPITSKQIHIAWHCVCECMDTWLCVQLQILLVLQLTGTEKLEIRPSWNCNKMVTFFFSVASSWMWQCGQQGVFWIIFNNNILVSFSVRDAGRPIQVLCKKCICKVQISPCVYDVIRHYFYCTNYYYFPSLTILMSKQPRSEESWMDDCKWQTRSLG